MLFNVRNVFSDKETPETFLSSGHELSYPRKTRFCESCPCGDVTDEIFKKKSEVAKLATASGLLKHEMRLKSEEYMPILS